MNTHLSLGNLNQLHELMSQLVTEQPENDLYLRFHSCLPSLGWLLGRSVYLELYWVKKRILGDADLADRVEHLFKKGVKLESISADALPPKTHLLNWALEIQDQVITQLANSSLLPEHELLQDGWIIDYLNQCHSQLYEQMISNLLAKECHKATNDYQADIPLQAQVLSPQFASVSQGHYRIGAREGVVFDNEQPAQMVELHSFRIQQQPVSNAEYLAFMEAGGYTNSEYWDTDGQVWLTQHKTTSPWQWAQDSNQNWYMMGVNGPCNIIADQAVSGLSLHEARAFAAWASANAEHYQGAILPHEYQWEVAARNKAISGYGRAWEWCANTAHAYSQYETPDDEELRSDFEQQAAVLKGGCLHTQPNLRRASYRYFSQADCRHHFAGLRLVLPPENT